uniref:P-type Cu(+) transporter n=1 Tax=Ditylenchus dipsaci TaxID=166011 RepID=A0A915DXQ6_9BILA
MAAGMMPLRELDMYTLHAPVFAGNPQQSPFYVKIQLSQSTDLMLIDVDADLNKMYPFLPKKNLFDSRYYVLPSRRHIGLSWDESENNISVFQQIAHQLDNPVISVWLNRNFTYSNGTGELTIGEEDTKNCKDEWQHVSEKLTERKMYIPYSSNYYSVHVSRVGYINGNDSVIENVGELLKIIGEYDSSGRVPYSVMNAFTNTTNAVYNSSIGYYVCDCDATNFQNVTLFMGGEASQTSKTIDVIVRPEDYVLYYHSKVGNGVSKQPAQNGNLSSVYTEHTLDIHQLAQTFNYTGINELKTKESRGLNETKAKELLELNGPNKLPSPKEISDLRLFISQFCNLLWILMAATSTISLAGHFTDSSDRTGFWVAMILYAMIVVMCSVSFWQEREARKVYCNQLKLETSSITGESEPIEFQSEAVEKTVTIFESRNVAFNGSYCVDGEGIGVVIRTGVNTVIGQIASMTTNQPVKKSHLEHQIKLFVKFLTFLAVSIGTTVFVIGGLVHHWEHITLLLVTAFSVCAVGMIPEGMPATVTSILTLVARRLAKKNVYLKRLDIVEALGSANIIASDKTGTLTKNQMTVTDIWYSDEYVTEVDSQITAKSNPREVLCEQYQLESNIRNTKINMPCNEEDVKRNLNNLFQIICTASGISMEQVKSRGKSKRRFAQIQTRKAVGSPSEVALIQYAEMFLDVHEFRQKFNIVFEIPFNSRRKFHLMIVKVSDEDDEEEQGDKCLLLMKGAAEILIEKCSSIMTAKGEAPMTPEKMQEFKKAYDTYAGNGRRVIGFAQKSISQVASINFNVDEGNVPMTDLVFIGICAIMDPPRDETEMAIRQCKEAGLKVFMVTGDHHATATAIAKQIGLINENKKGSKKDWDVVKGEEIAGLKDYDWDYLLAKKYLVFARTTPEQKLKIVEECQKRKQIIAMTGDG